jgi:2-isopropylmalate synthase
VNSQSGKGGVAYIMETEHGFSLPRRLQIEFSRQIQTIAEDTGSEISPAALWDTFNEVYLPTDPSLVLRSHETTNDADDNTSITAQLVIDGEPVTVTGEGNGPIAAFVDALANGAEIRLDVVDYSEHAMGTGSDATAVAYVETEGADGVTRWGIGINPNISTASLQAVLGAAERARSGT